MPRLKRAAIFIVMSLPLVLPVGCSHDSGGEVPLPESTGPAVGTGPVIIKGIAFSPREVHTTVGKDLVWTFEDGGLEHTVTGDDKSFGSQRQSSGKYNHAFPAPGKIGYHCEVHARMHGTIVVSE
jgi:plastocyanin